jgi:hypothetical protein
VGAQPPELELLVEWRWDWPFELATLETQSPMPWVPAAAAELLQLLTAAVTTSPWLVVLLDEPLGLAAVVLSSDDSSEDCDDDELVTEITVWCWWLAVGEVVSATALPAPASTATLAIPAAARVVTRLMSLVMSKSRYLRGRRPSPQSPCAPGSRIHSLRTPEQESAYGQA